MNKNTTDVLHTEQQALLAAIGHLLRPFAKLCLAKGVPIQAIEERVRHAYVDAAKQACEGDNPERLTSRISTMTGLTRREVAPHSANGDTGITRHTLCCDRPADVLDIAGRLCRHSEETHCHSTSRSSS